MTSSNPNNTVTVRGSGIATSVPDRGTIYISLESRAKDVTSAFESATVVTRRVIPKLEAASPTATLSMSTISLNAEMKWDENRSSISGYTSSVTITATDIPLDQVALVLSAAVNAGGDSARIGGMEYSRIGGMEYYRAEAGEMITQAREKAFANARATAEHLASLAGKSVGEIIAISDAPSSGAPFPVARESKMAASYSPEMPVLGGHLTHVAELTVQFELV